MVFTAGNRKYMAAATSEKEARLNYTISHLPDISLFAILYLQLLAAKD